MILVDSSGWIEYLAARPKADLFAPYIEGSEPLLASVIQVYEIYKVVRRDLNEERAIEAVSALRTTTLERSPAKRRPAACTARSPSFPAATTTGASRAAATIARSKAPRPS